MFRWLRRLGRDRLMRDALRARFVVTLRDGPDAFEGLLYEVDRRTAILVDVIGIRIADGARNPVDGALYLDRSRIAYMQRPDGVISIPEAGD